MRFCATHSDSHRVFLDNFFLKTFPFEPNVSLMLEKMPQKCNGGLFSDGWRDQMIEKQRLINKTLQTFFDNEVIVFCDVDIAFYGELADDLLECLSDNDIAFMKDHNNSEEFGRCGGFFIVRSNEKTRELFNEVIKRLCSFSKEQSTDFNTSEQHTINSVLKSLPDIKWTYLPQRYYTHGLYTDGINNFSEKNQSGLWWQNKNREEKNNIFIPADIKVHHANWAVGIDNKIELLDFVYRRVNGRSKTHGK